MPRPAKDLHDLPTPNPRTTGLLHLNPIAYPRTERPALFSHTRD